MVDDLVITSHGLVATLAFGAAPPLDGVCADRLSAPELLRALRRCHRWVQAWIREVPDADVDH